MAFAQGSRSSLAYIAETTFGTSTSRNTLCAKAKIATNACLKGFCICSCQLFSSLPLLDQLLCDLLLLSKAFCG